MSDQWAERAKLTKYNFKCECEHITKRTYTELEWDGDSTETRPETWPCEECGTDAAYSGWDPHPGYKQVIRTTFEKNGRLGYRYGDGSVISQTKHNYAKTGDTTSKLDPAYKKAMDARVDRSASEFLKKIK